MALRLDKPWRPVSGALGELHGHLGVFELADASGRTIFLGYAGGRSLRGLKGEVAAAAERTDAASVRWEITTAYLSRYRELLMVHVADHGAVPRDNTDEPPGRLSPA